MSILPRIFRRHQHLPLGCQPRSPECSTNVLTLLYVLAGLFRTLPASLPDSTSLICVLIRPTPHSERLSAPLLRTHGRYSSTAALYTQCVSANNRIDTQNTPNSARSHYNINSVIHINLITMKNASLSHNSTYTRLLQERTLNDPDFPCHHTRSPPVKAAISHGDHKTAK